MKKLKIIMRISLIAIGTSNLVFGSDQVSVFQQDIIQSVGEIERGPDGKILLMDQFDAIERCKRKGSRLPTARELALFGVELGATGIRETAYPNVTISDFIVALEMKLMKSINYNAILTSNTQLETVVDFYYNHQEYRRTLGFLKPSDKHGFWSSSLHPDHSGDHAYDFDGRSGTLIDTYRSYALDNAARCIKSQ